MSAITIETVNALDFLCSPKRLTFAEYAGKSNKRSSLALISHYFRHLNLCQAAAKKAEKVKTEVFESLNKDHHKEAYEGGVAQAYYDLCIAESIYTGEELLTVGERLRVVLQTLDSLVSSVVSFNTAPCHFVGFGEHIKPENKQLAIDRISNAVCILQAWQDNRIKYNETYESIMANLPSLRLSLAELAFNSVPDYLLPAAKAILNWEGNANSVYGEKLSAWLRAELRSCLTKYNIHYEADAAEHFVAKVKAYAADPSTSALSLDELRKLLGQA